MSVTSIIAGNPRLEASDESLKSQPLAFRLALTEGVQEENPRFSILLDHTGIFRSKYRHLFQQQFRGNTQRKSIRVGKLIERLQEPYRYAESRGVDLMDIRVLTEDLMRISFTSNHHSENANSTEDYSCPGSPTRISCAMITAGALHAASKESDRVRSYWEVAPWVDPSKIERGASIAISELGVRAVIEETFLQPVPAGMQIERVTFKPGTTVEITRKSTVKPLKEFLRELLPAQA